MQELLEYALKNPQDPVWFQQIQLHKEAIVRFGWITAGLIVIVTILAICEILLYNKIRKIDKRLKTTGKKTDNIARF